MPITFDKADEIPEGLRAHAKQDSAGRFVLSTMPEGWALEDLTALKSSLIEARNDRNEAKERLRMYEGLPPEQAAAAREALETVRGSQARTAKEIADYKSSVETKFATEKQKLESKLAARTKALREKLIRGDLAPVIAAKGGSDSLDVILTLAERLIRVEETEDGALKTSIVDAAGRPRVTKKGGSADPLGFDELIDEMRDAPSTRGLFKATSSGGAGTTSQIGGAGRAANPGQLMPARELLDRANARTG